MILDMSGGQHAARDVEALARRGWLLHLSPGDSVEFRAPLRTIMAKELRITGSLLRPLPQHAADQAHAQMERGAHVGKLVLGLGVPSTTLPANDAPP